GGHDGAAALGGAPLRLDRAAGHAIPADRPGARPGGRRRGGLPGRPAGRGYPPATVPAPRGSVNDVPARRARSPHEDLTMRITFIGAGNMASALIGGLLANGHEAGSIQAIDPFEVQRQRVAAQFGIACHADLAEAADCDAYVLAVKPQNAAEVVRPLAARIEGRLLISVAAGIRATALSRGLGGARRMVRAMPNSPALGGGGVTGLAPLPGVADGERRAAQEIVAAVGEVAWVEDEGLLDADTA